MKGNVKVRSNRMGHEPLGKLLFQFSIPAIVGMVASALYNIVDRVFIGHNVGPQGIAAITVAFPFFLFLIAMGIWVGVGSASQISRKLGSQESDGAEMVMGNGVISIAFITVFVVLIGLIFMDDLVILCGGSKEVVPMAKEYISIILIGVPFHLTSFCLNYFIRAEGHPRYAMWTLIIGAIVNIILDWIFIVNMGLGIKGAALGTIIGQFIAACWVLSYYIRHIGELSFKLSALRPKWSIIKEMVAVGFSPALSEMFFLITMIIFNNTLSRLGGDLAISAAGIVFSLNSLIFMPVLGIGEGVQPLVGFNYGAGNYDRCRLAVKLSMMVGITFFLTTFTFAEVFPRQLTMLFNKDSEELIDLTIRALRIGYLGLPVAAVGMLPGFVFQAIGKARQSLILNICRQVIFLLPAVLILPLFLGVDGVWLSFPVVDACGGILGFYMIRAEMKKWVNMKK